MNLSETAFVSREGDAWRLRWFTPKVEVALCGHATLAAAHILWTQGHADASRAVRFNTLSGPLFATKLACGVELDFPIKRENACQAPHGLVQALGATPTYVGRNEFDYLVEFESAATVRGLAPNFVELAMLPVRGVIVTSRADDPRFDFVSRFFAPAAGINEDPVTGSAHCCLADYWGRRFGKWTLVGHQVSSRGGIVRVRLEDPRVYLGGAAVTVSRGELVVCE